MGGGAFRAGGGRHFRAGWGRRRPQVSMLAVDELYGDIPPLERDRYWDSASPRAPYTAATAAQLRMRNFRGSAFDVA